MAINADWLTTPDAEAAAEPTAGVGAWGRVRLARASDEIVKQFRKALFDGELHAGDSLGSEKQLALQFGVSRTTIRDALRTLEASGVIEIRTGVKGGVRVAHGNPLRFADILAMQLQLVGIERKDVIAAQLGLESVAAELAASKATPSDLADLRQLLSNSADLTKTGEYRDIGYGFHEAVARASHNWAIITTLRAVHDLRREPPSNSPAQIPERATRLLEIHQGIYEAIAQGAGERASQLMREHLRVNLDDAAGSSSTDY